MPRAFISHIGEDKAIADRLKAVLKRDFLDMLEIFSSSDTESIGAGELWLESIERALRDATMLMVICSPESIGRPWINFEAGAAWMRDIPLIPVCHGGLQVRDLPMPLSLRQGISITDGEHLQRLYLRIADILNCGVPRSVKFDRLARELRVDVKPRLVLELDTTAEIVTNKLSQPAALYSRGKIPNPHVALTSEEQESRLGMDAKSQIPAYFIRARITNHSNCTAVNCALSLVGIHGPRGKLELSSQRLRWSNSWYFESDQARKAVNIKTDMLLAVELNSRQSCHCDVCFHYDPEGPEYLGEFQRSRVYFAVNRLPSASCSFENGTYLVDLQLHARFSDGSTVTLDSSYEMVVNLDRSLAWPERVRFRSKA